MDGARRVDEMIQYFVKRNVYLNHARLELERHHRPHAEFELEDAGLLYNPCSSTCRSTTARHARPVSLGGQEIIGGRGKFLKGFEMFRILCGGLMKAGGKIYSGKDSAAANTSWSGAPPRNAVIRGRRTLADEALMTSTKWGGIFCISTSNWHSGAE